jgi:hypothetical protein
MTQPKPFDNKKVEKVIHNAFGWPKCQLLILAITLPWMAVGEEEQKT